MIRSSVSADGRSPTTSVSPWRRSELAACVLQSRSANRSQARPVVARPGSEAACRRWPSTAQTGDLYAGGIDGDAFQIVRIPAASGAPPEPLLHPS